MKPIALIIDLSGKVLYEVPAPKGVKVLNPIVYKVVEVTARPKTVKHGGAMWKAYALN